MAIKWRSAWTGKKNRPKNPFPFRISSLELDLSLKFPVPEIIGQISRKETENSFLTHHFHMWHKEFENIKAFGQIGYNIGSHDGHVLHLMSQDR